MAASYEKVMGYILDLVGGDGSKEMAKYIDCPLCGTALEVTVVDDDEITVRCPRDLAHMNWHGFYHDLPRWIGEYRKLNA